MIRVVVADDQERVRVGFSMILNAQPDITVVAEAQDGREAVDAVLSYQPDVVVMDVRMPRLDGIAATREIQSLRGKALPLVLILTTFDLDEYVYGALEAGASGFLLKDIRRETLVDAVRTLHDGGSLLAPTVTRRLIEEFTRNQRHTSSMNGRSSSRLHVLTPRELETFDCLAQGLSNAEISAAWGVSEETVKTHVSNVLGKLHLRDRVQAVIMAYQTGRVAP